MQLNPIKKPSTCKNSKIAKSYLYLRSVLMCSRRKYFQACRAVLVGLSLRGDPFSLIFLCTPVDHAAPDGLLGPGAHEHLKSEKPSDQPVLWYRYKFVYVTILILPPPSPPMILHEQTQKYAEAIKRRVSRDYGRPRQILLSCLREIDKTVIAFWSPFKESLNIFVLLLRSIPCCKRSYFANI